jgi:chaperonin GroES
MDDIGFLPMADRVIIRPDTPPEISAGGIIIPRTAKKEPPTRGLVLATGPGMLMANGQRWPMPVKPGERVVFQGEGAQRVKIGEEMLLSVRDDFLLAVEEP